MVADMSGCGLGVGSASPVNANQAMRTYGRAFCLSSRIALIMLPLICGVVFAAQARVR